MSRVITRRSWGLSALVLTFLLAGCTQASPAAAPAAPTAQPTADIAATIQAAVQATMQAAPTATTIPSPTPKPSTATPIPPSATPVPPTATTLPTMTADERWRIAADEKRADENAALDALTVLPEQPLMPGTRETPGERDAALRRIAAHHVNGGGVMTAIKMQRALRPGESLAWDAEKISDFWLVSAFLNKGTATNLLVASWIVSEQGRACTVDETAGLVTPDYPPCH